MQVNVLHFLAQLYRVFVLVPLLVPVSTVVRVASGIDQNTRMAPVEDVGVTGPRTTVVHVEDVGFAGPWKLEDACCYCIRISFWRSLPGFPRVLQQAPVCLVSFLLQI